jgi:DNA repair protein RadC
MREAHAAAFPTSRSCSATNASELLIHVRETPHDQHISTSEALAVVVGSENATRLLTYMVSQDSVILPTLRALHVILREEPSEIITLIGSKATAVLTAALELSGTMIDEQLLAYKRITSADDSIGYVCDKYTTLLRDSGKEFFYVILLDIRNKVIKDTEISRGSISASVVDPADIVREACIHHASRVILVHNHPSGECDPSKEDIDTTSRIVQALKLVGVRVLDHVIVGKRKEDYFSFARSGMV